MEALEIIYRGGSLLIIFLLGYVFKRFNDSQKEMLDSLNVLHIKSVESDSRLKVLEEKNLHTEIKLKEKMSLLASDMSEFSKTLIKRDLAFEKMKMEVLNIKEKQVYFSDKIRKA